MNARTTPSALLKVGVIGCGKMGLNHVRAIRACPAATLVAVADPAADAAKLGAALPAGAKVFTSAADMLDAAAPDVVHIVTPPATHAELARMCLERGAHVYVEKPFTLTAADAAEVAAAAARHDRRICAGHQLLFEKPARALRQALPLIGRVVHVESYFSFRTVRKLRDGRSLMSPVEQLLDILPHPVYTLLDVLRGCHPDAAPEIVSLDVHPDGGVHALLRSGDATGVLVVTLQGRPVESYLRVVGTNGSLRADFVRGALIELAGAGASTISLLTNPYREGLQVLRRSTRGFLARIRERKKGYPGLTELFEAFYDSVAHGTASPLTATSILETVRTCERVAHVLRAADAEREGRAEADLAARELRLRPVDSEKGRVLVTGGSGTLGNAVVRELREHGWAVRSISRRVPPPTARAAGVDYLAADLGSTIDAELLAGVSTVVHCAAETAGDRAAHERNTIAATRNLAVAAASAGVTRFLHVSSIAVLAPARSVGGVADEHTPVDRGNLARGPYVWAKAEAECELVENAPTLGLSARVLRPGPLVDFDRYEPPGRLGRELGPVFVAVGPKGGRLSLCGVRTAAQVIRLMVEEFDSAPSVLNLVEPDAPTRAELVSLWLRARPDLRVIWLPHWVLAVLSPLAVLAQRVLRRGSTPIDLAAAFSSERYDSTVATRTIARARQSGPAGFVRTASAAHERPAAAGSMSRRTLR